MLCIVISHIPRFAQIFPLSHKNHIIPIHYTILFYIKPTSSHIISRIFPSFFPSFSLPTFFILFPTCFPQFPNIFSKKIPTFFLQISTQDPQGQDRQHDQRRDAAPLGALRQPGAQRHLHQVLGIPRVSWRNAGDPWRLRGFSWVFSWENDGNRWRSGFLWDLNGILISKKYIEDGIFIRFYASANGKMMGKQSI